MRKFRNIEVNRGSKTESERMYVWKYQGQKLRLYLSRDRPELVC